MEDNNSFSFFRKQLLKVKEPRHHKIKNSYTSKDIYRKSQQGGIIKTVSEETFYKIIRKVNTYLREAIAKGLEVNIPNIGTFIVTSYDIHTDIKEGKIKTSKIVDWKRTQQWWYEDEEAFKDKKVLRFNITERYRIYWKKRRFKHSEFFKFIPSRQLKIDLKNNIQENNLISYRYGEIYNNR